MAALDQLTGLMSVINGLKGQSQTTTTGGGTQTQQTNVSDAGIQQLLNQILSGSGGVKSIGSRARSSGLYNSTSEDLLLSNLYATAANQAELARSPTVTTSAPTTQTTTQKGAGIGDLAAGLGGAFLASQALNIGGKALSPAIDAGTNYITDLLSGLFGSPGSGGGTSGSGYKSLLDDTVFTGTGGGFGSNMGSSGTGISTGEGYGLSTNTLGNFGGGSTGQGGMGLNFGMDLDTGSGSVGVGGLGAIGSLLGSAISGLTGGSSSGGGGGSGGTSGGSIICTALMARGLLDADHYAAGDAYIQSVPDHVKVGYYVWAEKVAAKISAGHKGWTKVCLPFAAGRTALLATPGSIVDHIKHPLGTLTKLVGEPICGMIGMWVLAVKFSKVQGA